MDKTINVIQCDRRGCGRMSTSSSMVKCRICRKDACTSHHVVVRVEIDDLFLASGEVCLSCKEKINKSRDHSSGIEDIFHTFLTSLIARGE